MRLRIWALVAILAAVVSGCGRASAVAIIEGLPTAPTTVSPPGSSDLTLTASPGNINAGGSSTLTWTPTNMTTCTASGGWSGSKNAGNGSHTESVSPSTTTTYNLSCTGPGGTVGKSVTVTVSNNPNPPTTQAPTLDLSVNPSSINAGQYATLNWNSTNTTSCTASGGWSGSKSLSGSESISPALTTTYVMNCSGAGGSVSKSAVLTVNSPTMSAPTCTLSGSPTSITAGQSVTLNWNSSNATSWSGSWGSVTQASGSVTVTPNTTTTYTLACTGAGGTTNAQPVTITVATVTQQPTCSLTASSTNVNSGTAVTLNWGSSNATSWTSNFGTISQSSGSTTVTPSSTTTYTFSASGAGGSCSSQVVVTVNNTNTSVSCTWSSTVGQQNDGSVVITRGTAVTVTASCTNQNGQQILPAWYSLDPNKVEVRGTDQTTINGKVFETGYTATMRGPNTGTTQMCVQPALTQTFPSFCRTVTVQ